MVYVVLLMNGFKVTCQIGSNLLLLTELFPAWRKLPAVCLGPLLFYLNNTASDQTIKLFADNTNLFIASKDTCLINLTVNDDINKHNHWFIANRLSLNLDKTCHMVFLPHRSDFNVYCNTKLDGVTINEVESCRYIGLIIDNELN